jgi:hypothetical protein
MAADKGPSLIEVPDRSVHGLIKAAADAVPILEWIAQHIDSEEAEANASYHANEIRKALRQLRADMDPRTVK